MYSLGEVCIHVRALPYSAVAHTEMVKRTSVTSIACSWNHPVPTSKVTDLSSITPRKHYYSVISITPPTHMEIQEFYRRLAQETMRHPVFGAWVRKRLRAT